MYTLEQVKKNSLRLDKAGQQGQEPQCVETQRRLNTFTFSTSDRRADSSRVFKVGASQLGG